MQHFFESVIFVTLLENDVQVFGEVVYCCLAPFASQR